ncbi:MAG TPA: hypothetical protein VMH32_12260 [Burkholderiales bacterium]|nr:hypothetical protein [Burkholderiales bacterium]
MNSKTAGAALFVMLTVATSALAEDSDLTAGEKLYIAQCKICHGSVSPSEGRGQAYGPFQLQPVRLALGQFSGSTLVDVPADPISNSTATATSSVLSAASAPSSGAVAFAPPFGPNLRGVYGRPAGTAKGYEYSAVFLKNLTGMEWNDAALDVWITNPQAWVPGVYMFYKQPDPEIRRKIILYLKANP